MAAARRSARTLLLGIVAALGLGGKDARAADAWAAVRAPSRGAPVSIGSPAAGCIAGARALALDGPGWRVLRPERRRFFGHPALVAYVESLARALGPAGLAALGVGDLGQPRGGPMPGSHASHQTGLDVDLFFDLGSGNGVGPRSLVLPDNLHVDPGRWRADHARLLALAAAPSSVDRVFVHPAIKRALCLQPEAERGWLRKIRPWYGHDAHFHVRLRCPADSPACEAGQELPPGDGCDETLAWWFEEEDGHLHAYREVDPRPPVTAPLRERVPLPAACARVLRAS